MVARNAKVWLGLMVVGLVIGLAVPLVYAQCCGAAAAPKACSACSYGKGTQQCAVACAAAKKVRAAGVGFLSAEALSQKIKAGRPPIIIDVLSADDYRERHIKGAVNIPYKSVAELAPKILPDRGAEIAVYCASYRCGASLTAAKALRKLGYTNVHDYKGGISEWSAKKLPVEGSKS